MLMLVRSCETRKIDGSDVASRYQWTNQANERIQRMERVRQNNDGPSFTVGTLINKYLRTIGFNFSARRRR